MNLPQHVQHEVKLLLYIWRNAMPSSKIWDDTKVSLYKRCNTNTFICHLKWRKPLIFNKTRRDCVYPVFEMTVNWVRYRVFWRLKWRKTTDMVMMQQNCVLTLVQKDCKLLTNPLKSSQTILNKYPTYDATQQRHERPKWRKTNATLFLHDETS